MTTIIAVNTGTQVFFAADTMACVGDTRSPVISKKIFQAANWVIAAAGYWDMPNVIEHFSNDPISIQDLIAHIKDNCPYDFNDYSRPKHLSNSFLCATILPVQSYSYESIKSQPQTVLYEIDPYFGFGQVIPGEPAAIGSGYEIALGAAAALLRQKMEPEKALHEALTVATYYDNSSDGYSNYTLGQKPNAAKQKKTSTAEGKSSKKKR